MLLLAGFRVGGCNPQVQVPTSNIIFFISQHGKMDINDQRSSPVFVGTVFSPVHPHAAVTSPMNSPRLYQQGNKVIKPNTFKYSGRPFTSHPQPILPRPSSQIRSSQLQYTNKPAENPTEPKVHTVICCSYSILNH